MMFCAEVQEELKRLKVSSSSVEADAQTAYLKLRKEKDDLVELTVSRGKLIQERQEEVRRLQQRVEVSERSTRAAQDRLEQELAAVSVSRQVKQLKQSLRDLQQQHDATQQQFDAYKVHAQSLLQREKDLNARLRHLAE